MPIGTAAMTPSEIAISLRRDILTGHVAPGSDLPQEELARRFGVSRIPVRDALNLLAAEKLVRVRPNRGAQVISFSRKDLAEVYSLRVILETDCLARAIPDIGDVDLERIAQEMRRCEIEAGNEEFPEADWRFHRALYEPAGRPMQLALIEELRTTCHVHIAVYDRLRKGRDQFSKDHRRILAACRAKDIETAVGALRSHLEAAARSLDAELKSVE